MKSLILPLLLVCCGSTLVAQVNFSLVEQAKFSADAIPDALRKNADVVVRQYDVTFEVLNKGEAIVTEHKVMTLLNDNAADENKQYFGYDKLELIDDIEGAIYDGAGKLVRRIKKKDISDVKQLELSINDNRVKIIEYSRLPFPYAIEYTVVKKSHKMMFYPVFDPQEYSSESVESASLEISMPTGLELRIKELNLPKNCKTGSSRWDFKNIPAFATEPFMPEEHLSFPTVLTAPTLFTMEGYDGNMSTWQSFGQFIGKLNQGKDNLPPATVTKLKELTADCTDALCKVERVYGYLQQNTRYFNVALGIGGWQPMQAEDVDAFKYGDCKGLSNYTVAMLRAVEVPAFYVLIAAGEDEQNNENLDFPISRFNHAFACVPMGKDTLWLECTSQSESCGFLSDFTDDRPALVITPDGGKLIHTPKYDEKSNTIHRETALTLNADGSAILQSNDVYRGIPSIGAEAEPEEQKKRLYNNLSLSDFEIKSFDLKLEKGRLPQARRKLELTVPKFASVSGKRLFVPVVALVSKITTPAADSIRKFPVQATSRSYTMEDDLTITIPEGYSLENAVEPFSYSSPFGRYELSIKNEPGHLIIHRKLTLNNAIQPKEQFEALVTFFKNIAKADKTKLVLAKGT